MPDDLRRSFARQAARLTDSLNAARPALEDADIRLSNQSNESGFDSLGFPYFVWQWRFEKRQLRGSEIYSAAVVLKYTEQPENQTPRILIASTAEIFQIGKLSRYRKRAEKHLTVEDFCAADLAEFVINRIAAASFDD